MTSIQEKLFAVQDIKYRDFQAKLIPGMDPENMIGVRTPELRKLAKELKNTEEAKQFLLELPHRYFDENQLHAFLLTEEKSFEECIEKVEKFLPYIDNWATCDQLSPKSFKKHTEELLPYIRNWLESGETYTIRFGIGILMQYFLEEHFDPAYPEMVAQVRSSEYYVNMMIAWYFATAMAKQYDAVIPFIENKRLDRWTHNKTIQKCVESFRISPEQKVYLKSLKRTGKEPVEEQIERIRYYEEILTEAEQRLTQDTELQKDPGFEKRMRELDAYYGSEEWKQDFASDEAGIFPQDLKRGILSEDGIYNVLVLYREKKKEK